MADNIFIFGDDNLVNSGCSSVFIVGSGITINNNISEVDVFGSNIVIEQSAPYPIINFGGGSTCTANPEGVFAHIFSGSTQVVSGGSWFYISVPFENDFIEGFSLVSGATPGIKYNGTASNVFIINYTASISVSSNDRNVMFGVYKNGSFVHASETSIYCKYSGEFYNGSGIIVVDLAPNDVISLVVKDDSTTETITYRNYETTIMRFYNECGKDGTSGSSGISGGGSVSGETGYICMFSGDTITESEFYQSGTTTYLKEEFNRDYDWEQYPFLTFGLEGQAISEDGKYVLISNDSAGDKNRLSSDYGLTFISTGNTAGIVYANSDFSKILLSSFTNFIFSYNKFQTQTSISNSAGIWKLATDDNFGITVGYKTSSNKLYRTTNLSGNTWVATNSVTQDWYNYGNLGTKNIVGSKDMQYVLAYGYNAILYLSSDYGVNYTAISTGSTTTTNSHTMCMSDTGQIMYDGKVQGSYPTGYTMLYRSNDYGVNWSLVYNFSGISYNTKCQDMYCDSTGQYIFTFTYDSSAYKVFESSDYGASFQQITSFRTNLSVVQDLLFSRNGDVRIVFDSNADKYHLDKTSNNLQKLVVGGELQIGKIPYNSTNTKVLMSDNYGNITYKEGLSGSSGTSGKNGSSGTSGKNGSSGTSGKNGTSGLSGTSGSSGNGTAGTSGKDGTFFGSSGTSGISGVDGSSGTSGEGTSGTSGVDGTFYGTSGTSGTDGTGGGGTSLTIPHLNIYMEGTSFTYTGLCYYDGVTEYQKGVSNLYARVIDVSQEFLDYNPKICLMRWTKRNRWNTTDPDDNSITYNYQHKWRHMVDGTAENGGVGKNDVTDQYMKTEWDVPSGISSTQLIDIDFSDFIKEDGTSWLMGRKSRKRMQLDATLDNQYIAQNFGLCISIDNPDYINELVDYPKRIYGVVSPFRIGAYTFSNNNGFVGPCYFMKIMKL